MKVNLIRIDERLIHGQVMTSWVKKCWIKKIILVDDELVKDDFMKEVLPLSAPSGVKVEVRGVAECNTILSNDTSEESTLLLFKELKYVYELFKLGYSIKEVDIGNIGSAADRKAVTREVYMSEIEKKMCKEMNDRGVYVYIQKLPQDNQVNVISKI